MLFLTEQHVFCRTLKAEARALGRLRASSCAMEDMLSVSKADVVVLKITPTLRPGLALTIVKGGRYVLVILKARSTDSSAATVDEYPVLASRSTRSEPYLLVFIGRNAGVSPQLGDPAFRQSADEKTSRRCLVTACSFEQLSVCITSVSAAGHFVIEAADLINLRALKLLVMEIPPSVS